MSKRQQSLPGPDDITRVSLPNGITVLVRANFNSPSVVIGGHLSSGSLFDSDEKIGLADFTALGLMRGTETASLPANLRCSSNQSAPTFHSAQAPITPDSPVVL